MCEQDCAECLQRAVAEAARIREESWDEDTKSYSKTIEQAAEEACGDVGFDARMDAVVAMLLLRCWNDALRWAGVGT